MNIVMNHKKTRVGGGISRCIAFVLCLVLLGSMTAVSAFADDTIVVIGGSQAINSGTTGGFTGSGLNGSGVSSIMNSDGVIIGAPSASNSISSNAQQTVVVSNNKESVTVVSDGVKISTVTVSTAANNTAAGVVTGNAIPNGTSQTVSVPETGLTVVASSISGLREEIFEMTNAFRAENGLSVLSYNADLQTAANIRAQESAVQFNHVRPDGSEAFTVVTVDYNITGENLIQAENSIATASTLMETWKNSGTHRMNLLHPSYKSMAIGIYQENGMTFVSQVFIG